MKIAFIDTLTNLAGSDNDIFLLAADLGYNTFERFRDKFPDRFFNMGVAEANMIGVSAGLALSGKNVYSYSIIPFLTMRTYEQIRVDLCYHNLNVKLIGAGGGLTYGTEGMTHHAIEDVAIMRVLPNMTVVTPGDPIEVAIVTESAASHQGPIYIRLGRTKNPQVHETPPDFTIGKGIIMSKGEDITIISGGTMLHTAKTVADSLNGRGLSVGLIDIHTIKPLDSDLILESAQSTKVIYTIEEQSVIGGLGSAVAEVLAESDVNVHFRRLGLSDSYGEGIGGQEHLRRTYGLSPDQVEKRILGEYNSIKH
jgi:transketolase